MGNFFSLSLRIKLMLLLVIVTSLMLSMYGGLALTDFSKDKVAYVYSTLLSHSKNTSGQVKSELDFVVEKVKFYLRGFDFKKGMFHAYSRSNLKSDGRTDALWSYSVEGSAFEYTDRILGNRKISAEVNREVKDISRSLVEEVLAAKISLRVLKSNPEMWLMGLHFEAKNRVGEAVIIALMNKSYFVEAFMASQLEDSYLVDSENRILVGPFEPIHVKDDSQVQQALIRGKRELGGKSGIFELASDKNNSWLVSITDVGVGGIRVVSLVSKQVATSAIQLLRVKSIFFFVIVMALTVIISVLSSRKLTAALKELLRSTKKVAEGNFLIETEVKSNDEVGELAKGFNLMTVEIRRLLSETAEKARMEAELLTAQTVQSTLFPEPVFSTNLFEIRGYYEPASECGGDWFYYIKQGSKTFMLIGDATGHGVPAALVTAAAKSASRVIQEFPGTELTKIVGILNRAICETARGKVMMTFFVGCFDEENSEFSYVNASHDPPFLIPHSEEKLKKKNLIPLMGKTCARLGQDIETQYEKEAVVIGDGDRIVFYTDGVTELMNSEKQMWGERNFIKTLLKAFNSDAGIESSMVDLSTCIKGHRDGFPLDDDVTYFIFQKRTISSNGTHV